MSTTDIVRPNGNEKDFIAQAKKLGITTLYFAYEEDPKLPTIPQDKDLTIKLARIITKPQKKKDKTVLYIHKAQGDQRAWIEQSQANIIFGCEFLEEKDAMLQRSSGFNHVLATLAKKKNVTIGFFTAPLLELNQVKDNQTKNQAKQAQVLGRIAQNLKLCKKYGTTTFFASFAQTPLEMRNSADIEALFRDLMAK